MKRRNFLGASLAGFGLSLTGISDLVLAAPNAESKAAVLGPQAWPQARNPFVFVFLRGGADTFSLLSPLDDPDFLAARPPEMRIKLNGFNSKPLKAGNTNLYWHPNAEMLSNLFLQKRLAPWVAVGLSDETRSHFEAQEMMDRGLTSLRRLPDSYGWMSRQIVNQPKVGGSLGLLPLFTGGNNLSAMMLGGQRVLAARDLSNGVSFPGGPASFRALDVLCAQESGHPASAAIRSSAKTIDSINQSLPKEPAPSNKVLPYATSGATLYPNSDPGVGLRSVARLIQAKVGLQYACVDQGGWDTHEYQNGKIDNLVRDLSNALGAFDEDMRAQKQVYTLVVMTEFGRRLRTNMSYGSDHGHASVSFVMGDGIPGGQVLGKWPGLATAELDRGVDLAVTTDYQAVLAQVLRWNSGLG
jgi:uncharacterized protein (DUF1501 family)